MQYARVALTMTPVKKDSLVMLKVVFEPSWYCGSREFLFGLELYVCVSAPSPVLSTCRLHSRINT